MNKCGACRKYYKFFTADGAECKMCHIKYHRKCVGITSTEATLSDWICPECNNKPKRKNDNTPIKGSNVITAPIPSETLQNVAQREAVDTPGLASVQETTEASLLLPSSENDVDIRVFYCTFVKYMEEQRDFREKVLNSLNGVTTRVETLERRLDVLEKREAVASLPLEEVANLRQTVVQLKQELNDREQDALLADLDVGHLPEEKGENVVHIITALAAKLGVTVSERDIVFVQRVGAVKGRNSEVGNDEASAGRPRRVVVRFARRSLRDEMLNAARVRRTITSVDLGPQGPPRKIYLNERLTRTNRNLFHKVREECKKRQWRYSWTKGGRIFARRADGAPVSLFRLEADIDRVFGSDIV